MLGLHWHCMPIFLLRKRHGNQKGQVNQSMRVIVCHHCRTCWKASNFIKTLWGTVGDLPMHIINVISYDRVLKIKSFRQHNVELNSSCSSPTTRDRKTYVIWIGSPTAASLVKTSASINLRAMLAVVKPWTKWCSCAADCTQPVWIIAFFQFTVWSPLI